MEPLTKFRLLTVRISLGLVIVGAVGLFFWRANIAQAFAMGGGAGILGFWLLARRLEKFASMAPEKIQSEAVRGIFIRLLFYGLALVRSYYLDPVDLYPLFAAVAGIFVPRVVIYYVALTGLDLKQDAR